MRGGSLDYGFEISSDSTPAITFTFGLMPLGERYESFYSSSNSLNSVTTFLLQGWLWRKITHEG